MFRRDLGFLASHLKPLFQKSHTLLILTTVVEWRALHKLKIATIPGRICFILHPKMGTWSLQNPKCELLIAEDVVEQPFLEIWALKNP